MFLDKARQTISRFGMLKKGDRVVVAVSGGPDSMALLYLLNSVKKELHLSLFVAHLNHGIRKGAAEKDARFVERAAKRSNLPFIIRSENIPQIAKDNKLSVEEAARDRRYDLYLAAAKRYNAKKVALGHTRDDQAETVLMRLVRGSGLLGLSGIPPVRKLEDTTIIRPLIEVSKDEILKTLAKKNIAFRRDVTNIRPVYFRNKVRLKLLPFLKREFLPTAKEALAQIADNLRVDYEYLSRISDGKFKRYARCKDGAVELNLKFLNEDRAIQRMIVRSAIKIVKGDLDSVTYRHWEDLSRLLDKKSGWSMVLPGGIFIRRAARALIFETKPREQKPLLENTVYEVNVPGRTAIRETGKAIEAGFVKGPLDFKNKRSGKEEYFNLAALKLPIYLRFRKKGDKIRPMGMAGYKKLKDLFIDEKVPSDERAAVPLIVSGRKIIWACGIKRSDEARVGDTTKKILKLRMI